MNYAEKDFFITYHNWEEFLVFLICVSIAGRLFKASRDRMEEFSLEQKSRLFLVAGGFVIMGLSSFIHAFIHAADLDLNLLYHTLIGYCFGLLILTFAISSSRPQKKTWLLLLYLPLFVLLVPEVYETFPLFGKFRPLVWISIAFLAGHVCILHVAAYYRIKRKVSYSPLPGTCLSVFQPFFCFSPLP
jgi:hypothetical protein